MHIFLGRPPEDEEAGSERRCADYHGRQARLRHGTTFVRLENADVVALICQVHGSAETGAEKDGEERE